MSFDLYIDDATVSEEERWFDVNGSGWRRLCDHMARRGMLDLAARRDDPSEQPPVGISAYKLADNAGEHVGPEEILTALAARKTLPLPDSPALGDPDEGEEPPAMVDPHYKGPRNSEAELRILLRRQWLDWIAFLERAAAHGGFYVY